VLVFAAQLSTVSTSRSGLSKAPKLIPIALADSYIEGAEVALLCNVRSGERPFHYTWLKDGTKIQQQQQQQLSSSDGQSQRIELANESVVSRLSIRNVSRQDAANYTCRVSNQHGSDSVSAHLVVHVELKWIVRPPDVVTLSLNEATSIECSASGEPTQPTIKWTRLSTLYSNESFALSLPKSSTLSPQIGKSMLNINKAQLDDSGLYECQAFTDKTSEELLRTVVRIEIKDTVAEKLLTISERFVGVRATHCECASVAH
ncbi:Neural cell adhesion molecule 2, partial [Fragariocoptes setiger]